MQNNRQNMIDRIMLLITIALFVVTMFLLGGCAGNTQLDADIQHDYYEAVKVQANARASRSTSNPTISLQCGQHHNACKGLSFAYTDPDQSDGVVVINRARTTAEVNAEAMRSIVPNVIDGAMIGLGIWKGADILSDAIEGANNAITQTTTTTTTTNTADNGSKVVTGKNIESNNNQRDRIDNGIADSNNSNADSNDNNSVVSDSNDNNSTVSDSNDNNSTVSDSNDNNAVDNSQQNRTADPTIVEQPPPVIVDPSYPPGAE